MDALIRLVTPSAEACPARRAARGGGERLRWRAPGILAGGGKVAFIRLRSSCQVGAAFTAARRPASCR